MREEAELGGLRELQGSVEGSFSLLRVRFLLLCRRLLVVSSFLCGGGGGAGVGGV